MNTPDNRALMPAILRFITTVAALLWLPAGVAETNYVVDKLLVGVHQEKNLDSAIIKVLPTGTTLEVVERDGEIALIEGPDKVRGWVDSAYLTDERPAVLLIAALEQDKDKLEKQLAELQKTGADAAVAVAPAPGTVDEINALTTENTELKGKLSEQRLRAEKLQTEMAGLRAEVQSSATPPDARIVELERDRDSLKRMLSDAEDRVTDLSARASLTATSALVPVVLKEYATAISVFLLVFAALAFGGGIYVVDVLNRRRHGGFRVRI